jgi:hypothetical protein
LLLTLSLSGALAATPAEQQSLLKKSLANPSDYATAFAYVRVSEELGDYEAAIGTLERLLFYNPNLTRAKYELGSLYFQAHSYQLAVHYFADALSSPDIDAATKARIDAILPEAKKQASPVRSWIFVESGLRYQSNASSTPSGGQVLSAGILQPFDFSRPHGADWSAFTLAQFSNEADFGGQSDNRLETNLTGYYSDQFRFSGLDTGLISGTIGPRLALMPDRWPGLTIRPYATGSAGWVGGDPYGINAGAGVSLSAPVGGLTLSPSLEWQRATYNPDPGATLGTADWLTGGASVGVRFSDAFSLTGSVSYRRAGAAANPWQDFDAVWGEVGLAWHFAPPLDTIAQKWTLAPFLRLSDTLFDAPDPSVAPGIRRHDRKWQVGAVLDMPLTAHFGLSLAATYERFDSSVTNYSYDNWSVLFGPTARF